MKVVDQGDQVSTASDFWVLLKLNFIEKFFLQHCYFLEKEISIYVPHDRAIPLLRRTGQGGG